MPDWGNRKILITGGTGFLGQNLLNRLRSLHSDFISIDKVIHGRCEDEHFKRWLDKQDFDVIYHLGSPTAFRDGQCDAEKTINGIKNIISYAANHNTHVIFPSSAAVYGNLISVIKPIFDEEDSTHPFSLYHGVKLVAETLLNHNLDNVTILRISNGYGAYEDAKGSHASLVTKLCYSALNHKPIEIYGNGESVRDYIYVSDIIDAMIDVVDMEAIGTFNLGSGAATSSMELVDEVSRIAGNRPELQFTEENPLDYIANTVIDISKFRKLTNTSMIQLGDGVQKTLKYLAGVTHHVE